MNLIDLKNSLNDKIELVLDSLNIQYEVLGDNIYSSCPIHENSDNSRGFSFCKRRNIWKCWTRDCEKDYKNDIFGLIQACLSKAQGEEIEFSEILKWIKVNLKINISKIHSKEKNVDDNEFENLVAIINNRQQLIQNKSISCPCKYSIPSKYFMHRGFSSETLKYFQVGDCEEKDSKMYNRAVIPIYDNSGKSMVGIIGRSVKENKIPKFLIYPKGMIKNNILYNLNKALEYIKKFNAIILVEGQGDVWKLYESGIYNAVGMFGKSLSCQQIEQINKLPITTIIVITDNDQAGKEAKIQIKRSLGRLYKLIFPVIIEKDIGEMSIEDIKTNIIKQIEGYC